MLSLIFVKYGIYYLERRKFNLYRRAFRTCNVFNPTVEKFKHQSVDIN
jgi:hypothetical protein